MLNAANIPKSLFQDAWASSKLRLATSPGCMGEQQAKACDPTLPENFLFHIKKCHKSGEIIPSLGHCSNKACCAYGFAGKIIKKKGAKAPSLITLRLYPMDPIYPIYPIQFAIKDLCITVKNTASFYYFCANLNLNTYIGVIADNFYQSVHCQHADVPLGNANRG